MNRLRGFSKEKGGTPEYDQGGSVSEIPEDIRKAAENLVKTWISDPHQDDADLAQIVGRAMLAERERCAKRADDQKDEWQNATWNGYRNVDYANGRAHGAAVIAAHIRGEA